MADLVIAKGNDGRLEGIGEKGQQQYAKFRAAVKKLEPGETIRFSYSLPRSPGFHRRFFARLGYLFDTQEQFDNVDALRMWLTVAVGECDFVPGPKGKMVALPKSIAWHRLEQADFEVLVKKIDDFLWTPHAHAFLWPHLTGHQVNEILLNMDREYA